MSAHNYIIRKILPTDNKAIEQVIKSTFIEVGLPLVGTAYEDKDTSAMYEAYQEPKAVYYVIEHNSEVFGGGGIKQLNGADNTICEIQKMYFSSKIRGLGLGKKLFDLCLKSAKEFGYKQCYLESAKILKTAIHIYEKNNFKHLSKPLGNTGHDACGVFMIKEL